MALLQDNVKLLLSTLFDYFDAKRNLTPPRALVVKSEKRRNPALA